jgi:tyrosyl-tRNA synthetase
MPRVELSTDGEGIRLTKALFEAGLVKSGSEGRRRVEQGAVQIDGQKVSDVNAVLGKGGPYVIKAGKRAWATVVVH